MKCYIRNETKDTSLKEYYPLIRSYFKKAFKVLDMQGNYEITLILTDPENIQKINREYRHIDKVTDVISFSEIDGEDFDYHDDDVIYLGDIFINIERVKLQAEEYEHSIKREFVFLFIHGLLHCLGYDHMVKEDEIVMIEKQKMIIGELE